MGKRVRRNATEGKMPLLSQRSHKAPATKLARAQRPAEDATGRMSAGKSPTDIRFVDVWINCYLRSIVPDSADWPWIDSGTTSSGVVPSGVISSGTLELSPLGVGP